MRKAKILITFDDGIYNQKYALDYINSLGMCGVVGVVANKIDKKLVRQSIIDQTDPVKCTKELLDFVNLKIFKKGVV